MFRSNFVIDLAPSSDWMVSSLLCVCVCVCFAVQHRMWQSPRQRHRWLCDARNSNKPKNPQKPRKTQGLGGVEGGEGRGFIFPTNSFIWLWAGRIRPNGSKTLSTPPKKKGKKKKITFFCGLEFRAFNLSVTCSTIRTVCLPSYLSHVRVSTKGVRSSDLQDVDCVILSDQLLSKPKTPLYFSQLNFYSYLTLS